MTVDRLQALFTKEKHLREIARKLHAAGVIPDASEASIASFLGNTATGRGTRSMKASEWSLSEAAQACGGLHNRYFFAHRYTYALDDSVFHSLARFLLEWALERRETPRDRWPTHVVTLSGENKRFLRDLVDLWMLEVRQPWRFVRKPNGPDLRRIIMDVSEPTWRRRLSPIYETIAEEFVCWLSIARGHMQARLRDDIC